MTRGTTVHAVIVFTLAFAMAPAAQKSPADGPGEAASFEVASVKPNKGGTPGGGPALQPNGGYSATNVALKSVIANAYEVRIFQVEGGPDWLTSERFDIIARGKEGTPDRLRPAMLRSLLAERFKLVAHFETREQPVYALVLASSDGRLGPRLKLAPPVPQSSAAPAAAFPSISVSSAGARMTGSRISMENFATMLTSSVFSQRVIDRTGLKGEFELDLQFAPDSGVTQRASELPSIFTAVQEQLGLRLRPERGPVPFLVIDSVQQPTPD